MIQKGNHVQDSEKSGQENSHVSIWHILKMLLPYKWHTAGAVAALLFTAVSTLSIGRGINLLIDQGFASSGSDRLLDCLVIFICLGVAIAVGSFIRYYLMTWLGERIVADLRYQVFSKIIEFDIAFFEKTRTGELLSRLTTDTTLLQTVIGSSFSLALRNAIVFLGGLGMMFFTNAKLAVLALTLVPFVILPIIFIGRRVRTLSKESQERVADVGAFAEESINAIRTVKAFVQEQANLDRFDREVKNAFKAALKRAWLRSSLSATVTLLVFTGLGTVIWAGGNEVISGQATGGELGAFLFYAILISVSAGLISEVYGDIQRALGATERLMELIHIQPTIVAPKDAIDLDSSSRLNVNNGRITFEHATFYYTSRPGAAAIRDLSLNINKGETLALVGPSGAGKSTIFQLLLRFYDTTSGQIRINGNDITKVDPMALRQEIALVPQDPFIFSVNAMENIRYGNPIATKADVIAAAKEAMIDQFINSLPDGYQTYLGEKGVRLSGGQKQRLSIARAILKNPSFLLLDEATSALDAENERLVQQALSHQMGHRTTLVIAHRLSTVLRATRIAVLIEGQLVAIGSHDDLIRSNDTYRRFADLQFIDQKVDKCEMDQNIQAIDL